MWFERRWILEEVYPDYTNELAEFDDEEVAWRELWRMVEDFERPRGLEFYRVRAYDRPEET